MKASTKNLLIGAVVVALLVGAVLYARRAFSEGFADGSLPTFTLYYANWCPHCKTVKPLYEQWMKKNGNTMSVNGKTVSLAIVEEKEKNPSDKAPVKGYPTFILNNGGQYTECRGSRDPSGWEGWLKTNV
jgi:thiol-disulfide isomerase/thioredoxin